MTATNNAALTLASVQEAWSLVLADRAEHELTCWLCTPSHCNSPVRVRCPEGVRLADADAAAHALYTRARFEVGR